MVYIGAEWGTVCDDGFTQTSAEAACYTLGFSGGSYSYREAVTGDRHNSDPMQIWMDTVRCPSGTSDFLTCPRRNNPGPSNCGHFEDVVLYCD